MKWTTLPPDTLIVASTYSKCNNCGCGANPYEKQHHTAYVLGVDGCEIEWHYITSFYTDTRERCEAMRPDLEWIDP